MQARVRSELHFSSLVILSGEEVVPRFRVIAPAGETVVFLPLPDLYRERLRRLSLLRAYLAWRMAKGYIMSAETTESDAVLSLGVMHAGFFGLLRPIRRNPVSLGEARKLDPSEVDDGFFGMLPAGMVTTLDAETVAELKRAFGPGGEFEAQALS